MVFRANIRSTDGDYIFLVLRNSPRQNARLCLSYMAGIAHPIAAQSGVTIPLLYFSGYSVLMTTLSARRQLRHCQQLKLDRPHNGMPIPVRVPTAGLRRKTTSLIYTEPSKYLCVTCVVQDLAPLRLVNAPYSVHRRED